MDFMSFLVNWPPAPLPGTVDVAAALEVDVDCVGDDQLALWPPSDLLLAFPQLPLWRSPSAASWKAFIAPARDSEEIAAQLEKLLRFPVDVVYAWENADIVIYVDSALAPANQSLFDLQVRPEHIVIHASDPRGMFHGLHALLRYMKSHGRRDEDHLCLSCMRARDSLISKQVRAVTLSMSYIIKYDVYKELLQFLSSLRYNTVFIFLDYSVEEAEAVSTCLKECMSLCSELFLACVPMVSFDQDYNHIFDANMNLLSHTRSTSIAIFNVQSEESSDPAAGFNQHTDSSVGPSNQDVMNRKYLQLFEHVYQIRCAKIYYCLSDDMKAMNIEQLITTMGHGIQCVPVRLDALFPGHLKEKPLLNWREYVTDMLSCKVAIDQHFVNLPLHSRNDDLYPEAAKQILCGCHSLLFTSLLPEKVLSYQRLLKSNMSLLRLIFNLSAAEAASPALQSSLQSFSQLFGVNASLKSLPSIATEQVFWRILLNTATVNSTGGNSYISVVPTTEEAMKIMVSCQTVLLAGDCPLICMDDKRLSVNWRKPSSDDLLPIRLQSYLQIIHAIYLVGKGVCTVLLQFQKAPMSGAMSAVSSPHPMALSDDVIISEALPITGSPAQQVQQKRAAVYDHLDMSRPYAHTAYPKDSIITTLLTNVVRQNLLFRDIKEDEYGLIVQAFQCIHVKAKDVVIKQGDIGEYFYVVQKGQLDVLMESCGVAVKVGRTLVSGDYFGELALMYNTPRAATVICKEDAVLWRIDRFTYRKIITQHNKETSDEFTQLLSNVTILGKRLGDVLSPTELNKVVATLEVEKFEDQNVIIRQHQTGDYFYIINEGIVDVYQEAKDVRTGGIAVLGEKVATLQRGDYFGEKALLKDDVRQASCVAVGTVVCLSLSREDFIAMIGNWQDVIDTKQLSIASGGAAGGSSRKRSHKSVYDDQNHLSIYLPDLQRLNVLGVGAFGSVRVVRHATSGQLYALKSQSKSFLIAQNMQEMVLSEMRIMRLLDHSLISKFHAAMQDSKFIYFLLELLPGGEFFTYLQKIGKLSEDKARFYAAGVVLALEELSKYRIAYRDLKPENMVMDAKGYVKLVDFGLAKVVASGSTWTMCGTPDYLAPEIILNKGHNYAVDYWSLGVLIFEMVHGWPPFYHDQPMKVYEKIVIGKYVSPITFSKPLEDVISKLLNTNPSKRLGNIKGGVLDIVKHKWFGSFDWQGMMHGSVTAPYVPDLSKFEQAIDNYDGFAEEEDDDVQETDWNPEL